MAATVTGRLDLHIRRHTVDVRLDVPLDGVTVLFGPSGAGKTTVLRAVAGLDRAGGRVVVDGRTWDDGTRFVPARRRRVGYLSQEPTLFPHLDVDTNVGYGLAGVVPRSRRTQVVRDALEAAGAGHLTGRRVTGLSGGEAQRVALARALAPGPRLLLLDEPLSALDAPTRAVLRADLRRLLVARSLPTLLVTHDRTEALALGDRVAVVVDGTVRQVGGPAEVFDRPADPDVARVVDVESVLPGVVRRVADGVTTVAVGGQLLTAATGNDPPAGPGDGVLVCVRAEDVALEAPGGSRTTSPRNHLPAVVRDVVAERGLIRVDLDCGFPLAAYITRPALEELGLRPGVQVTASVKAPAVHLIPRDEA